MTKETRKNKRIYRKRIIKGIIIFTATYLLINFFSTLTGISKDTILPQNYILYDKLPCKGIVLSLIHI